MTTTDPNIDRIISFFFDPRYPPTRWFAKDPALDAEITSEFGPLISAARTSQTLDEWKGSPRGSLALLLLLDQFPRNVYRDSAEAYSSDHKALAIASRSIAQGYDRYVPLTQQAFFYLPFEHDEDLASQVASVALFEGLVGRCESGSLEKQAADTNLKYALSHRNVFIDFGRFPSRNSVLGRQSTFNESEFLKAHPSGFRV